MEVKLIEEKTLIRVARMVSAVFTPFSIPFLAFLILFLFSYLSIMPIQYKLIVLGIVYCFTIMIPVLAIFIFKKINGFSAQVADDEPPEHSVVHEWHHSGSPYHDGYLHCGQPEMEAE